MRMQIDLPSALDAVRRSRGWRFSIFRSVWNISAVSHSFYWYSFVVNRYLRISSSWISFHIFPEICLQSTRLANKIQWHVRKRTREMSKIVLLKCLLILSQVKEKKKKRKTTQKRVSVSRSYGLWDVILDVLGRRTKRHPGGRHLPLAQDRVV